MHQIYKCVITEVNVYIINEEKLLFLEFFAMSNKLQNEKY